MSVSPPPAADPLVYAVVLNHCSAAETIRCVQIIRQVTYPRLRVLVVDNGSADGSVAQLARALPDVEICRHDRNRGYGDGNNRGIRRALAAGADLIWIVTPDARVRPDALVPLVELMRSQPGIGVCGPIVHAGDRCIAGSRLFPRLGFLPRHAFCTEAEATMLPEHLDTDYVDGCAILLRREMIEQIGLFRDDFFLYFDETEYCLRASQHRWRVVLCARSHVHTRPIDEDRNHRSFYMVRNSILLARTQRRYVVRTVLRHTLRALLHVLRLRRHPDPRLGAATWQGIRCGLFDKVGKPPRLHDSACPPRDLDCCRAA